MDDDKKKLGGKINHLVMGIILGGAVGSVLGLTLAPRKGKETREIIKKKGEELVEKGKAAGEQFAKDHHETIQSAKFHMKKGGKGFFRWLFKKKSTDQPMPKMSLGEDEKRRGL